MCTQDTNIENEPKTLIDEIWEAAVLWADNQFNLDESKVSPTKS